MNLRERLQMIRPAGAAPESPAATSLKQRVERMAVRAQSRRPDEAEIASRLRGEHIAEGLILIERRYSLTHSHGNAQLGDFGAVPTHMLADGLPRRPEGAVFLDTETSGLAGGTGTIAFLLGMARIEDDVLLLRQWLLTGFRGEAAMLEAAQSWLKRSEYLITFNGKTFDVPLLIGRYRLHRMTEPLGGMPHLDLLHPMRAAFAKKWDDCRLQTAERRLLRMHRDDDLPGALVPEAWSQFVRLGLLDTIPAVLEHNRLDILSLPACTSALARVYAEPGFVECDALAVARRHLSHGRPGEALRHLEADRYRLDDEGLLMLAALYRRCRQEQEALAIWQQLAEQGMAEAVENLAKYCEHRARDYGAALDYTHRLAEIAGEDSTERRAARLHLKLARTSRTLM